MNIKINDGDPFDFGVRECLLCADGDVIEQAEPHGLVRFAVVTRWAYNAECPECLGSENLVNGETDSAAGA